MAAGLTSRSPFLSPLDARFEADDSRRAFARGTQSDHLAIRHAYALPQLERRGHTDHPPALSAPCRASRRYEAFDGLPLSERFHFARQRFLGIKTLQASASLAGSLDLWQPPQLDDVAASSAR